MSDDHDPMWADVEETLRRAATEFSVAEMSSVLKELIAMHREVLAAIAVIGERLDRIERGER